MPKGNHSTKTLSALVVVDGGAISDKSELAKFQAKTAEQLAVIETTERGNVVRRLFVGLALHAIKASVKHGEWLPWLKKNAKGASYRQTAYMMAAALEFAKRAKLGRDEVLALKDGDALALTVKSGPAAKIAKAAEKFVGAMTWGELLAEYKLKEQKKPGGARTSDGDDDEAPVIDEEQLYLFARDEIGGVIQQAETLLVTENRLQHLAKHPEEVRGVVESLRMLADKVEAAAKPLLKK